MDTKYAKEVGVTLVLLVFCLTQNSRAQIHARLFGGTASNLFNRVGMLIESQKNVQQTETCSGTFISQIHFLTARHCVQNDFFDHPIFRIYRARNMAAIRPRSMVVNPESDMAIITIPRTQVRPFPLLQSRAPQPGDRVELYGYGLDQHQLGAYGEFAGHYLKGGTASLTSVIPEFFIFTNTRSGGACHGDSGGPMIGRNASGKAGIIGVANLSVGNTAECVANNRAYYASTTSPSAVAFLLKYAPEAATD